MQHLLERSLNALFNDPKGRVHGNGFMQIDVPGTKDRVHLWGDPRIPCQKVATPIHNHRFSFKSTILHGRMINLRYVLADGHEYDAYRPLVRKGEDTILEPTGTSHFVTGRMSGPFLFGQSYTMTAGEWHETFASGLTVTYMEKTHVDKTITPNVLCLATEKPDNDFNRYDQDHRDKSGAVISDVILALEATLKNLTDP